MDPATCDNNLYGGGWRHVSSARDGRPAVANHLSVQAEQKHSRLRTSERASPRNGMIHSFAMFEWIPRFDLNSLKTRFRRYTSTNIEISSSVDFDWEFILKWCLNFTGRFFFSLKDWRLQMASNWKFGCGSWSGRWVSPSWTLFSVYLSSTRPNARTLERSNAIQCTAFAFTFTILFILGPPAFSKARHAPYFLDAVWRERVDVLNGRCFLQLS